MISMLLYIVRCPALVMSIWENAEVSRFFGFGCNDRFFGADCPTIVWFLQPLANECFQHHPAEIFSRGTTLITNLKFIG